MSRPASTKCPDVIPGAERISRSSRFLIIDYIFRCVTLAALEKPLLTLALMATVISQAGGRLQLVDPLESRTRLC